MDRDGIEPFSESRTYRVVRTLRRWADSSRVLSLGGERALLGAAGVLVLVSVVAVFRTELGSGVKFLSFALLFVCLAGLTARFADPGSD